MASNGLVVENMLGLNAAAFKCNRTGTKLYCRAAAKYGKCYDVKRWQKLHIAADEQTRCLVELHLALQC